MKNKEEKTEDIGFAIPKENYRYIIIGMGIIILGFLLMIGGNAESPDKFNPAVFSTTRITIAPILVLLGFIFEIWAIMRKPKNN